MRRSQIHAILRRPVGAFIVVVVVVVVVVIGAADATNISFLRIIGIGTARGGDGRLMMEHCLVSLLSFLDPT